MLRIESIFVRPSKNLTLDVKVDIAEVTQTDGKYTTTLIEQIQGVVVAPLHSQFTWQERTYDIKFTNELYKKLRDQAMELADKVEDGHKDLICKEYKTTEGKPRKMEYLYVDEDQRVPYDLNGVNASIKTGIFVDSNEDYAVTLLINIRSSSTDSLRKRTRR